MENNNRSNDDISYFSQLPKELKELILLNLNLNIVDVLKIQSTSKEWRELAWRCLTDLDTDLLRDVELTDGGQRTTVIAKAMHRLKNPGVLRRLIMNTSLLKYSNGDYQVYTEIYGIAHKCKSLEYLEIGDLPPGWVLEYADSLKNLSEISFERHSPTELSEFDLPKLKCRANAKVQHQGTEQDNKETPISPKLNFSHDWPQQEPIKFNKKYHRGGMIGNDLVAVGATDGTLTFFKLDITTTTLTVHSSNNIHKGCINEIWNEQSQHTYVASSDGIVTAWDPSPEGPVLIQTIEFPEDILFVCDTGDATSKHILAANSHKLFIADLKTGKITKTEQVDDSITGLFGNTQRVHVGTTKRFYARYGTDVTNGVIRHDNFTETPTPNFWVTPDASFRSVVLPHEVQCIDLLAPGDTLIKRYPNPNSAKFDSRSGLSKFNPVRYWLTVSTGTNIVTYDLEDNAIISSISPRISRSEIDAGNFPTCHSLWWDTKGEVLFGLFSNNTLCLWHLPSITKQRIEQEAQQEKQKQEERQKKEEQAKEKQEEHQAVPPPSDTPTNNDVVECSMISPTYKTNSVPQIFQVKKSQPNKFVDKDSYAEKKVKTIVLTTKEEQPDNFDVSYFNQLPKELKELILLDLNLNIGDVLKIQSTSKEWRELAWRCLTDLDTNLLRDVELHDGAQWTTKVISRLNLGVLRKIIMDANRSSIYDVIHKCHSLEYLVDSGYQSPWVLEYTDSLKLNYLSEVSFVRELGFLNIDVDQLKCRANMAIPGYYAAGQDNKETPISPKLNFSHTEKGEWVQKEPIKFNKKYHRGGMIGADLVVIGATDGTLTFFKLDTTNVTNATLVMHSSNNTHKGSINEIWNEQSQHTYVASSDGIVTAWDSSPEGPVLVQTIEFPEEILFVCDSPSKHILAASSHKLFIADIETAKIIKTEQVDDSIIGLFGNTQRVHVGTTKQFYTGYDSDVASGIIKRNNFTEALTPNFWVTPDASFRSVVLPNEVHCIDLASGGTFKRYPNPNSAKFDSRSGVLKFNPVRYWFSVSTGTNIVTYDLEPSDNAIISSVSPRISRSEIDAGNFPTCHSLWWDTKGEVLFGLYTNNTLCWWHLPRLTKERIDAAIQQEKQKQEEQQAKEKKQEEQQALVVPPGTPTDDGNSGTSEPDTNAIK